MKRFLILLTITTLATGGNLVASQPAGAQSTPTPSPQTPGCASHRQAITDRTTKFLDETDQALAKVNDIRSQVDAFYASETTAAGLRVPNYPALAKQLTDLGSVAQKSLEKTRGDVANINCDKADTIGTLHGDINGLTKNLKTYRSLVRAWIVTVRTADVAAHKPRPTPVPSGPPVLPQ